MQASMNGRSGRGFGGPRERLGRQRHHRHHARNAEAPVVRLEARQQVDAADVDAGRLERERL